MRTTKEPRVKETTKGAKTTRVTDGKEQPSLGKKLREEGYVSFGSEDADTQRENLRLRDEAANTVLIGNNVPQFNAMPINVTDPNASLQMKLDSKTYPGQMVRKEPNKIIQGLDSPAKKDPHHHSTQGY